MRLLQLGLTPSTDAEIVKSTEMVTRLPQGNNVNTWWGAGWFSLLRESFTGAWQRSVTASVDTVLSHSTAWSCITLIANDIAKAGVGLVQEDESGICNPATNPAYTPVLTRPNHYQNRIQFIKSWMISKLLRGNAYILKERDQRGVVVALYPLDPTRVQVLVAPDGEVFYQLQCDALSGITQVGVAVPAIEIIHDIYFAPFHPLVGVSPIYACGMAVMQGLRIIDNTSKLMENGSQPGGVLTAPQSISDVVAKRIQEHWDNNFSGSSNVGKVAVLGDGLKFERMAMSAVDAQVIEQLKWGDEKICSAYHVPPYMVGVGTAPKYDNIEALNQQYYSQCLQILIEELELCLEEGLKITAPLGVEFNLDALLRMDSATKMKTATEGVGGGIFTPNDGRRMFNKKPLKGGDTVYLQQQDYSIEALAARDSANPAPSTNDRRSPAAPPAAAPEPAKAKRAGGRGTSAHLIQGFREGLAA